MLALGERALDASLLKGRAPGHGESGASSPFLRVRPELSEDQCLGTESHSPFFPHSNQHNGGPTDWAEPRSTYVCKNCSQMFYTEKGLSSHMCFHSDQWPSPRGKQEPQVKGREAAIHLRMEPSSCGEPGWGPGVRALLFWRGPLLPTYCVS